MTTGIQSRAPLKLSATENRAIMDLLAVVWPPTDMASTEEPVAAFCEARQRQGSSKARCFYVRRDDGMIAFALVFPLVVSAGPTDLPVWGLGNVCTHPDHRGHGWARKVLKAAFAHVDESPTPLCLFQTGILEFYEKLGARKVSNRFINSKAPERGDASPWWSPHIMIYPASAAWPEGTIDLNGPGF